MMRFPPRKILVPFDFSDRSRRAWRYARELAARFESRVYAVYVSRLIITADAALMDFMTPEERERIERRLGRVLEGASGLDVEEGDPVVGILRAAERVGADLIVMATHGYTGLRRLTHESVTEEVVRASMIPVLAIHADTRLPRKILAPVNLAEYSIDGFHFAERVASAFGAALTLFHVEEGASGVATARRELALASGRRASPVRVDVKVAGGPVVERILEEGVEHDLIVMAAHRGGLLRDAILGTTAEQTLRRSQTPVLCVPAQPGRRRTSKRRRPAARRARANRRRAHVRS